jgi:hypothetical protein
MEKPWRLCEDHGDPTDQPDISHGGLAAGLIWLTYSDRPLPRQLADDLGQPSQPFLAPLKASRLRQSPRDRQPTLARGVRGMNLAASVTGDRVRAGRRHEFARLGRRPPEP